MAIDVLKKLATPDRTKRYKILFGGVPLLPDHKNSVQEVEIEMEINVPTMWTVRMAIANTGAALASVSAKDFLTRYRPGVLTTILFTTESIPLPMVTGPLTAIEPELEGDQPAVELRGFDLMYRLQFGTYTTTYPKMTDSAVATAVGAVSQVPIIPEPTTIVHDAVQQYDQSNYEFLKDRADRIGFEMISEAVGVTFAAPLKVGPPVVTLSEGDQLISFEPKLNIPKDGQTYSVYSYDLTLGKPIITAAIPVPAGAGLDASVFQGPPGLPLAPASVVALPAKDQIEAQQLAQAAQDKAKRNFITGRGKAVGDPKIRPGVFIFIKNIGLMFSGLYYVTAATHTINEQGYFTEFEVRRGAI